MGMISPQQLCSVGGTRENKLKERNTEGMKERQGRSWKMRAIEKEERVYEVVRRVLRFH
jgi:hypothetical protein